MRFTVNTSIFLAQLTGLLLIVLSIGAFHTTINSLVQGEKQEVLAQDTLFLLNGVIADFKTAESLQRRYLLTHVAEDVAAYELVRSKIRKGILQINKAGFVEKRNAQWQRLGAAIDQRIELMDQAVVARQQSGLPAATELVMSDINRQLSSEIQEIVESLKNSEVQRFRQAKLDTLQRAQTIERLSLLGGVLSFGILIWAMTMVRRSQARLSDSEAMSRAIAQSMAEGLITVTQDGRIVNVNDAARRLFGYDPAQMTGQDVAFLVPLRYRPGLRNFFAQLGQRSSGVREAETELLALRRGGIEFPVAVSFADLSVRGKRLFTAVIRDVTESKRAARALRDSESQLRQLTDSVPALIAYVDKNECFQFHNKAYEKLFDLTGQELRGRSMHAVMGHELYGRIKPYIDQVLAGYAVQYEREQLTRSGEKLEYVINYFPRYGEDAGSGSVVGFFLFGSDVTELKRIDRMKTEFVSTVSHELRTPLTSIRGSLGLVLGGITGVLPVKAHGLLEIARNNCERLIRLINEILDSEKIESGKMAFDFQILEIRPLIRQAIDGIDGFAEQHKIKVVLHASSRALRVQVDSDRMLQVVTNLLSNAIKFSPPGGQVQVILGRKGGKVRLEVKNTGPGISEAFKGRIFQKFSQADSSDTRQNGGTGLGLNISKSLVERMDGAIGFASSPETGTTFHVELPEWHETPPVTAPASIFGIDRARILVCEDDTDVAKLLGLMLDGRGFDIDIAHTTAQARDYLSRVSYALITVDLKLPFEGGFELIKSLRGDTRTAHVPVIVLSVTALEARVFADPALAIDNWLTKPIDEDRLYEAVRSAIRTRKNVPVSRDL
jgi:PAS domain S-box-containing protein